ncbi:MAG: thioredoxin family protein [Burkholderiales bacterium]
MTRILAALALAGAALGAQAQSNEVPAWFAESFLEFPQDANEAAQDGKRLMLYFWQDGCPYCRQMTQTTFADPALITRTRKSFVAVALDIFGDREVQWFDGRRLPEKALARALDVRATPTIIFLDEKGNPVLRTVGYLSVDKFGAALEQARSR